MLKDATAPPAIRVAAVQMTAKLGNVDANLANAERSIEIRAQVTVTVEVTPSPIRAKDGSIPANRQNQCVCGRRQTAVFFFRSS